MKNYNNQISNASREAFRTKNGDELNNEVVELISPVVNLLPSLQIRTTTDLDSAAIMLTTSQNADTYLTAIWVNITSADTVNHTDNGHITFYDWLGVQRNIYGQYGTTVYINFGDKGIKLSRNTALEAGGLGSGGFIFYEVPDGNS